MISNQRKRQAVFLIAAALTAVLLLAGWLSDMTLSPGGPVPGLSLESQPGLQSSQGEAAPRLVTGWVYGVSALAAMILLVYLAAALALRVPFEKLLRTVGIGLVIWAVLSFLPAIPPGDPQEAADLPGGTVFPTQEFAELGRPPDSFVRTVGMIVLGLIFLLAFWLARSLLRRPALTDQLRNEAGMALASLRAGEDMKNVIIRCYLQMQQELADSQGIAVEASLTPREFQEQMAVLGLPEAPVRQLTHLFEEVRYGHKPTGPREEQLAVQCLSELAQPGRLEHADG